MSLAIMGVNVSLERLVLGNSVRACWKRFPTTFSQPTDVGLYFGYVWLYLKKLLASNLFSSSIIQISITKSYFLYHPNIKDYLKNRFSANIHKRKLIMLQSIITIINSTHN